MKKHLLLLISFITFISCQMTERFYLNENGSVKFETEMDFTEMMGYMYDDATKDSLRQIGEFPIDTLVNFADLQNFNNFSNDSISDATKEFMKVLDKVKVRMIMNDEAGKMLVTTNEKDVTSFNAYVKKLNEALIKLEKEDAKSATELVQTGMLKTFEIKYDGKHFERNASDNNLKNISENDDSSANAMMQMMQMFQYKMEYHFPKRIKSANIENATYSLDGKVMTVDVPLQDLVDNPEKYNFKIEFE